MSEQIKVDEATVVALVADQFPQWAGLPSPGSSPAAGTIAHFG
jgi:hypothetical protein